MKTMTRTCAAALAGLVLALPLATLAGDKPPMPQTRGMQGMDPALHDKWDKEGKQDPYKDCRPDAKAQAVAQKHPMPETRGMKGMDPRAHTMVCPEGATAAVTGRSGPPR